MPNYHIRIESDEDGVLGEWDLSGFVFAFDPHDGESDLRWIVRGISNTLFIGMMEAMKAESLRDFLADISDGPKLLDS